MDERLKQLLALGREHYVNREYEAAEPHLREFAAQCPGFADVHHMLGVIYHHQEKLDEAIESFEKALRINPGYTEAALNLAVTYNDVGRYAEAKDVYDRVMDLSRTSPHRIDPFARGKLANMHAELGEAYAELRLYQEAVREYAMALQLCPDFADLRTRLGHVLRDSGDMASARLEYERAKLSNPAYVPARVHLGVALFTLGRKQDALREWEAALEVDPTNRSAATYLRMVRQLMAQEEAQAEGVPIDVREEGTVAAQARDESDRHKRLYVPDVLLDDDTLVDRLAPERRAKGLVASDTIIQPPSIDPDDETGSKS